MTLATHFNPSNALSILKSVVETAVDGILVIDTSGTMLMVNPAVITLFGYASDELLGNNISMLMPTPHRENHDGYLHNYLTTGIKKIIGIGREVEGLRKDGSRFPLRLAVSEIILDDKRFFTGIVQNITEIHKVQQEIIKLNYELEQMVIERTIELQDTVNLLLETNLQLNQSIEKHKAYELALVAARDELRKSLDKEKELSSLKSRFVSMASHEFKTPLSSILSSAALITKYTTTEQDPDRTRHVDRIKSSVNHLNNILTDFLSITRLEEGQFTPAITTFTFNTLLKDLQNETEGLLKKDQRFISENEGNGLELKTDKNILRNILYNLISNAVKYSDEGKTIKCKFNTEEGKIRISIQDEGMGIPLEDQKHIGSRFFRASNAVNVPGTGLGLNIVMAYLNSLQGELTFESKPGEGATFIITIPIQYEK
ncbi:MAG TPA: PAS domain-containing sensor histidine kinase [Saprospiraceae bacterium]